MNRKLIALALVFTAIVPAARAQISVSLELKPHPFYVRHEAIRAAVRITNLSGRDLLLSDAEAPWFGFTVTQGGADNLLSPRNPDYKLDPLEIKNGETLKREVDLNTLFPFAEYGPYRVKATIFSKQLGKFFSSKSTGIEITEGRVVWQQTVGVPEAMPNAGATHRISLLSVQGRDHMFLYCRVEDPDTGAVYSCFRIGHLIDNTSPQMQFDTTNTLHVLHLVGPKTYQLTQVGVNGELVGHFTYIAPKLKPSLRRDGTGSVAVYGASRVDPPAANATVAAPKLSDRPPGLGR